MSNPLAAARLLLLIVPAAATLVLADMEASDRFIFGTLAAIAMSRMSVLLPRWAALLIAMEMIWLSWMAYHYDGLMSLLLLSPLIAAFSRQDKHEPLAGLILLNAIGFLIGLQGSEPLVAGSAAIAWAAVCAVLAAQRRAVRRHDRVHEMHISLSRSMAELEQARERLRHYAAQVEHYAQTEERSRIAREIHDDLGHRLIRLKLMMEAGLRLLEHDQERARDLLEQVRLQLEESMDNMRRTVRKLSPVERSDGRRYALDRLIGDTASTLGIQVELDIQGLARPLYPSSEFVLYRNAQEAITNALRHGGATTVHITLWFEQRLVRMTVKNNGALPPDQLVEGLGLQGMRERAVMLGGKLSIRHDEGYAVITELPLAAGETR